MKRFIFSVLILLVTMHINTQQIIESSQYMNNDFLVNPAVAGTKANMRVSLGARKQWAGFDGAPFAQNLAFQGRVAKSIGFGASVYNDTWGLSRRTGFTIGINYILPVTKNIDLSLGISGMLNQFSIKYDKIKTEIPDDIAVHAGLGNQLYPDVGFSFYLNSKKFYLGASATNIIEVKNDLANNLMNKNFLNRTVFGMAGVNIDAIKDFTLSPSLIFGYTFNGTNQIQADLKAEFKKTFWFGLGYRNRDAIITNIGMYVKSFTIGYSYDYTISYIQSYAGSGSHELFLAFDIIKDDSKSSWFKRNRIYNQNRR